MVFLGLSTGYVCEQAAVAQLTFESDNRSTGIRLATGAQWLFCWIGLLAFMIVRRPQPMSSDAVSAISTVTATYITAVGLLFSSAPDSLSRRVSRGLPRSSTLRVLWAPFLPGAARAALFPRVPGAAGPLCVGPAPRAYFEQHLERSPSHSIRDSPGCLFTDLSRDGHAIRATAAALAQRIHSYQVLAILVLVNLLLIVGAEVIHFLSRVNTPQLFDVVNPFTTLRAIADADRGAVDAVSGLVVAAVVAIAANASALWCGVRDIVNDPVRAQIESQPHPAGIVD